MALLTVTEFRAYVETPLEDADVQRLLDAAEQAILRYAGPYQVTSGADDSINELFRPVHGPLLSLSRRAARIDAVIENADSASPVTLAADDYELRSSGYTLRRLHSGTNPRWWWWGRIDVTYAPLDDAASREIVQLELVKLEIATNPGLAAYTTGSDSETYRTDFDYAKARDAILATLSESVGIL